MVFFSGFGCSYGYATLQPHCRPSAKNTTSDCASWKAKSTTLNTWSGRKTTRSVTTHPTPSPTPVTPQKQKMSPGENSSIHNPHACYFWVFCFKLVVKQDCTLTIMLNNSCSIISALTAHARKLLIVLVRQKRYQRSRETRINLPSIKVFPRCCRTNTRSAGFRAQINMCHWVVCSLVSHVCMNIQV